ncbi:ribonuclease III [Candidatus Gottesmanbacteria bacterium RIFCSPHIGHO2_01_FULL_42_12]|uniref:Ribonuclease 3 n=1 Tax=Candidatus Gottesmanbacteria bacterium RIFCSPHIGHO2_01_FULL_42_12 TaxID=1798377 RepID=A0A1F5Z1T9_9BACT|nr:MAG: ribonuclease III [Candidatus Gottesmanbacteria bacterium RIFCSPHIGHO2_01_FULL_42_12]
MDLDSLEKKIGVNFKNKLLLAQALVHRSYLNESKEFSESNERLEFLGDAVLSILTSEYLYKKFPKHPEGQLTNTRSVLVRGKTLAEVARSLSLGDFLLMSRGERESGGSQNSALLADATEALIGALYLDQGLETVREFLEKFLYSKDYEAIDFKSVAQELSQAKLKLSPKYKVIKAVGPDHNKIFTIGIYFGEDLAGTGEGKSKQEAEQAAAKVALEKLTKTM